MQARKIFFYLPATLCRGYSIKGDESACFFNALKQAGKGKLIVFTIHGVPDKAHPCVSTWPEVFKKYMQY